MLNKHNKLLLSVNFLTGWAAAIRFNERIRQQFDEFRCRSDTFSLGVCNGCQLMALLGWVGSTENYEGDCSVYLLAFISVSSLFVCVVHP